MKKKLSWFCMKIIITLPHKKNSFFLNIYFSFYHNISVFISIRGRRRLLFSNGVLFPQEILNELILLCMDYNVPLMLENVDSQKQKRNITLKLPGGISKFIVLGLSAPTSYFFTLNEDFWSENQTWITKIIFVSWSRGHEKLILQNKL